LSLKKFSFNLLEICIRFLDRKIRIYLLLKSKRMHNISTTLINIQRIAVKHTLYKAEEDKS